MSGYSILRVYSLTNFYSVLNRLVDITNFVAFNKFELSIYKNAITTVFIEVAYRDQLLLS